MNKLDYLALAVAKQKYLEKDWVLSVITVNSTPEPPDDVLHTVFNDRTRYYTHTEEGKVVLEGAATDTPLFPIHEQVTIDSRHYPHLKEPTLTTYGNLLFNLLCVHYPFQDRWPYQNQAVKPKALEQQIAAVMQDTPKSSKRDPGVIYVEDYLKFGEGLQFVAGLSQYITNSGGLRLILPPKGLKEKKEELIAKYGDRLNEPVEFAAFEKELLEFDNAHLKEDPGYGKFIGKKLTDNARKKMYLDMGIELGFDDRVLAKPITTSLNQGVPLDPEQFATIVNGSRYGSFSRGSETIKGGVSAKVLLRTLSPYSVVDSNCGSRLGIEVKIDDSNKQKYIGRYIVGREDAAMSAETIGGLVGKSVTIRTPMYCKLSGERVCKVCAGESLAQFPNGLAIPAAEISSTILISSLKRMHVNQLATVDFTADELFT